MKKSSETPGVNAIQALVGHQKRWLPTPAAAAYVGLSPATLEVSRCTGRHNIPYHKIGGKVLYDVADLDAFLAGCRVAPVAA